MAPAPLFEFPAQMRELAERNVEQVRAAYGQFLDAARNAQDMIATMVPDSPMKAGVKQVQERTMRFAQQNIDVSFSLASELAKAYSAQAQELGHVMAEAVQNSQIRG